MSSSAISSSDLTGVIGDSLSPALPPGLPDPATLARLAGEFLAALPGQAPGQGSAPQAHLPSASSVATSAPAVASLPAAGGVPVPANAHPAGLSLPPGSSGPATPAALPFGASGALPAGSNLISTSPQAPANIGAQA